MICRIWIIWNGFLFVIHKSLPEDPLPDNGQDSLAGDFSSIDPSLVKEYDGLVDSLTFEAMVVIISFLLLACSITVTWVKLNLLLVQSLNLVDQPPPLSHSQHSWWL